VLDARSIPLIIIPRGGGPRKNGGPKCSGLEGVVHSRAQRRVTNHGALRCFSTRSIELLFPLRSTIGLTRTRNSGHSRAAEELWNRTLVTRVTVTPVDPPAGHSAVEYRRKPAPQKAIATSLARSPGTSSNFTICRARQERTHHRRAWKRATSLPTERRLEARTEVIGTGPRV